jgi:hypothetical protein
MLFRRQDSGADGPVGYQAPDVLGVEGECIVVKVSEATSPDPLSPGGLQISMYELPFDECSVMLMPSTTGRRPSFIISTSIFATTAFPHDLPRLVTR